MRSGLVACVFFVACAGDDTAGDDVTGITGVTGVTGVTSTATATAAETMTGGDASGGSGDSGVGGDPECPYTDAAADEDADGVANGGDLCPCAGDPKQRDFDGDGRGDACDNPLLFTLTEGGAPTNLIKTTIRASVETEILGQVVEAACEFEMPMLVSGSEVLVRLGADDRADLWIARLDFADSGVRQCNFAALGVEVVHLKVELTDLSIEGTEPYAVGFPFKAADHAAGGLRGLIDGPQPIAISGNFVVLESDNETLSAPGVTPLSGIPGVFATGEARVEDTGARFKTIWSDPTFVVFDQIVSESGVRVQLSGMEGTLQLR